MCIACPSGQKAEGSEKCVNCPFGYSGFTCKESWKLVLVIVGSVLGGLLLITLILLPIVARKQANGLKDFANAGVPRIPRATTTSWNSGTNLEMTPNTSRERDPYVEEPVFP
ncbi:mucin-13 isoform X4 [Etheostoma spectabile]|uniref:mucin-13 isoform X4 n=1 Tax=Etheostoma spectabile TaxID=54343 RepID=UPI0013AF56F3|nr:mucin-13-like isoform X4 [Etheostoma spectabile]